MRPVACTLLLSLALGSAACRRASARPPAVRLDVTPEVRIIPALTTAGRPVAVQYRWRVGPGYARDARAYRPFVHFLSADGAILIQDGHDPKPLPEAWSPGTTIEYTRIVFTHPQFPGLLEVRLGLVDAVSGARVGLNGRDLGQASYAAGTLDVGRHAPSEEIHFHAGFSAAWTDNNLPFDSYRWMGREGTLACRNPHADAIFFLRAQADARAAGGPLTLRLAVGPTQREHHVTEADTFTLALRLPAESLGTGDWTDVTLSTDKTYATSGGLSVGLLLERAWLMPAADVAPEILEAVEVL
jgi:hypothetical protein